MCLHVVVKISSFVLCLSRLLHVQFVENSGLSALFSGLVYIAECQPFENHCRYSNVAGADPGGWVGTGY